MMKDLIHTGVGHDDDPPGRGSGRYGWGTGKNPGQHQFNFGAEVNALKKKGFTEAEIAKMLLGPKRYLNDGTPVWATSTDLKAELSIERTRDRKEKMALATKMLEKYNGNKSAAARAMGLPNESSLRSLLDEKAASNTEKYQKTADLLRERVNEKGMIDVGKATEYTLGVTANTKKVALSILEKEGYMTVKVNIPQATRKDQNTAVLALVKPLKGETPKETFVRVQRNKYDIQPLQDYSPDNGRTWWTPEFPESMSSKKIKVNYTTEDGKGGVEKDGVIEINPNAKYLSLDGSQYAQVRIAVDGTHYMKGMAVYGQPKDFPPGIDVIYNTNKKVGVPMIDKTAVYDSESDSWSGKEVLKRMKIDQQTGQVDRENPFGAAIKAPDEKDGILTRAGQHYYKDKSGKEKLSPVNKVTDDGDWSNWSKNLSVQFLSKQPIKLIKQQIDLSIAQRKSEYDEIMSLTNPVIKKKLLNDFASNCDSTATELSVKGFKNQMYHALLPIPSLKDDEIYAPNYPEGEMIALVRFPHAGGFEIPVLKNTKKNAEAKSVINNAPDAVGINKHTADVLSGADFDGDTAIVIPLTSNKLSIYHKKPLAELEGFEPKDLYALPSSAPKDKHDTYQKEMGVTTNLIADMTAQGAPDAEIARAVKHSMVVIDAEKHHLDWRQSRRDNDIAGLKEKYQKRIDQVTGKEISGASTIFTRAKNPATITKVKEVTDVTKMTPSELKRWNEGKKVYREVDDYIKKQITDPSKMTPDELKLYQAGKKVYRQTDKKPQMKVRRMEFTDDAFDLVRNPKDPKEVAYANYANELKSMANRARKEYRAITAYKVNPEATKAYAEEVASLKRQLRIAQSNSPRERRAHAIAQSMMIERKKSNPDMDYEHQQREEAKCLSLARTIVGAKKQQVIISDKEWEAIQAKAVTFTTLNEILNNTDQEAFKKRAMPRKNENSKGLSDTQMSKILAMYNSGMYTQREIADALGVSPSTISSAIKNK